MPPLFDHGTISWPRKFHCAIRGVAWGVRSQINFVVHLAVAAAAIVMGVALAIDLIEWCLLAFSVTAVLAAELFNTAVEHLARAITREEHPEVRDALDTAAGAVLVTAGGSAVVGAIVFVHRLAIMLELL